MSKNLTYPGTCLGPVSDLVPGNNTYVRDSMIYSSVLGNCIISRDPNVEKGTVSVETNQIKAPYVGAVVVAQVTKLHRKKLECNVVSVDGRVLKDPYKGVLASTNVHESKNIDVIISDWFKPGDIIKAKVIYAGDGKQIILTTSEVDLGVIKAQSATGEEMTPISWKYFLSRSGTVERRWVVVQ
ncbi:hypothetical protein BEWA_031400 [Theileria equi strain WA]|uniref:Exosome complex component N-terminal domain-containing protein n=1 Tax=Theileria equi strain WA TaxID=1537102 RepID=L0AXI8_THEEQ|nr:hypothetical protein BEWA_031400 [Theileria equi strain WA]AFZ80287.1 hypothetical protein BEWA_031400 [Theileria equi strain WA]|eukprot:XP_004829953.1 hypothetical protein BEWA_031400 [Theileria equi strain WA]